MFWKLFQTYLIMELIFQGEQGFDRLLLSGITSHLSEMEKMRQEI